MGVTVNVTLNVAAIIPNSPLGCEQIWGAEKMSTKQYHHHQDSQLFLIRVWPERGNDGEVEWQGKLQHVVSGEAHSFYDWPTLVELFLAMLQATQNGQNDVVASIVRSPGGGDKESSD